MTRRKTDHPKHPTIKYARVEVYWKDAVGGERTGWRSVPEIVKDLHPSDVVTVGFVIHQDAERIIVLPHCNMSRGSAMEGDGEITIPWGWVQSVVELVEGKHFTWTGGTLLAVK